NGSPVSAARARRKSSNISFQAAAWTVAVRVRTPSRSKRPARMPSGRPSTARCYPKGWGAKRTAGSVRALPGHASRDEALLVFPAARIEGAGDPVGLDHRGDGAGRVAVGDLLVTAPVHPAVGHLLAA